MAETLGTARMATARPFLLVGNLKKRSVGRGVFNSERSLGYTRQQTTVILWNAYKSVGKQKTEEEPGAN